LLFLVFAIGAAFGYAVRAGISWHRRTEARRRYQATGSFRRTE
jgi:hypothetical protein